MSRELHYLAADIGSGLSLGAYLRRQGYSEGMLAQLRHQDAVRVNGSFHRLIDPLAAGDSICVSLDDRPTSLLANHQLELSILYEDEDLLALDKPPHILIHPASLGFDDAVGNFFAAHWPGLGFRPIGRLDRNTSGVCLIAKNRLVAAALQQAVDKDYYALALGYIKDDAGLIDAPLLRVPGSSITRRVDAAGQPSRTRFTVLQRGHGLTYLRLQLLTGRTHQIRAHLQYLGYPLAGDSLYGGDCSLIARQALHCGQLRFTQPLSGQEICISSPLPPDMASLLPLI